MNPFGAITRDRAVLCTARILLIILMAAAATRLVLLMFGVDIEIRVDQTF